MSRATDEIATLIERLDEAYPDATYALNWETPLQLLIATILAAQCTDERVNAVTETLFEKYPDAHAYAEADLTELEKDLRPTGYYRKKARAVQGTSRALIERWGGAVPRDLDALASLPGVARKTANVVLNVAFGVASGVIVDTHVSRASQRLGLSANKQSGRIERDLMRLVPEARWTWFGPALVLHGRHVCTARAPRCESCILEDLCEKRGVS